MVEIDCGCIAESTNGVWVDAYYVGVVVELFNCVVGYHCRGNEVVETG